MMYNVKVRIEKIIKENSHNKNNGLCISENIEEQDFSKSFMYSLHQIYFLIQKHLEKVLHKEKSISFSQFIVMFCFYECRGEDNKSQSFVAKFLNITEATVSRHISKLLELDFIKREEDKTNRRKHIITTTKKGEKEFLKVKSIMDKTLSEIFGDISDKDKKMIITNFNTVLNKLTNIK